MKKMTIAAIAMTALMTSCNTTTKFYAYDEEYNDTITYTIKGKRTLYIDSSNAGEGFEYSIVNNNDSIFEYTEKNPIYTTNNKNVFSIRKSYLIKK